MHLIMLYFSRYQFDPIFTSILIHTPHEENDLNMHSSDQCLIQTMHFSGLDRAHDNKRWVLFHEKDGWGQIHCYKTSKSNT